MRSITIEGRTNMTVGNKNQNEQTMEELIFRHNTLLEEQNELLRYYIENCAVHNFNKGNMKGQWQDSPFMFIKNLCAFLSVFLGACALVIWGIMLLIAIL